VHFSIWAIFSSGEGPVITAEGGEPAERCRPEWVVRGQRPTISSSFVCKKSASCSSPTTTTTPPLGRGEGVGVPVWTASWSEGEGRSLPPNGICCDNYAKRYDWSGFGGKWTTSGATLYQKWFRSSSSRATSKRGRWEEVFTFTAMRTPYVFVVFSSLIFLSLDISLRCINKLHRRQLNRT
jgi:hypothetical protein